MVLFDYLKYWFIHNKNYLLQRDIVFIITNVLNENIHVCHPKLYQYVCVYGLYDCDTLLELDKRYKYL